MLQIIFQKSSKKIQKVYRYVCKPPPPMKPEFCEKYNRTWVINPHSEMKVRFEEHDGSENEVEMIEPKKVLEESRSPHTIDSKVQLFRDFGKCFLEETREEFPEVFHKL